MLPRVLSLMAAASLLAACAPAARPPAADSPGGAPASTGQRGSPAAPAPALSPAVQELVDAARAEGQLTLVSSGLDDPEELQQLIEGFNRAYGLDVQVQFTPNPNMPEIANKVAQEYRAGRPSSTDVFLGTESHVMQLVKAGALLPVDWLSWAPNIQNPALVAPDGVAVELVTRTPGMTYNTSRLRGADVPASLQDLLKPQYKGRIASTPYAGAFTNLASPELWGEARVLDFVSKYSEQLAGIMGCGEGERVANAEFDIFALDCGSESLRYKARGAPVDHAILTDVAILVYWFVAVPANAQHPNAAKLWVNHLLGREAQDLIFRYEYFDHHLVPGSKSGGDIERLQAQGVKFTEIDVEWSQRHEEQVVRLRTEIQGILQRRR
jgi:iron(III) transport system substrate-binding protein